MVQHNEFFAISQIKQKKQKIKTTPIDITATIFTLKNTVIPPPLLEKTALLICNILRILPTEKN